MRTTEAPEAVRRLVRRTSRLQSSPKVIRKLLALTRTPDFNMQEVVSCLEHDPALAARILCAVNSSHYGLAHRIASIRHAAAILGQRSLRMFTVTFALVDALARGPAQWLYDTYWQRALLTASAASRVVTGQKRELLEDAYTAGLLADVGLLVFAQFEADEYPSLYGAHVHGPELCASEQRAFGFDHTLLGSQLLADWGLPASVVDAVAGHHAAEPSGDLLQEAVVAGTLVADWLSHPEDDRLERADGFLHSAFSAAAVDVVELAAHSVEELRDSAETFGAPVSIISANLLETLAAALPVAAV